jgi:hypothetical protein
MRHWPVDTVSDRYDRDPQFRVLTDQLEYLIANAKMTPTEVREAAVLATIHYEQRSVRPFIIPLRTLDDR